MVHLKIYEYYDNPNIKTNDTLSWEISKLMSVPHFMNDLFFKCTESSQFWLCIW